MNLSEIDSFVNSNVQNFKFLVDIFNMRNNLEQQKALTSFDLLKFKNESIKLLKEYPFDIKGIVDKIYQESVENKMMDEIVLDNFKSIYEDKATRAVSENVQLLLNNADKNIKKSQIRNIAMRNQNIIKYENGFVYDSQQRKISLIDKFRKDLRKVLIDYVNDITIFSAYYNGKSTGYTLQPNGKLYKIFSLKDYIKGDVKNTIFHPNVQSLAYVED